MKLYAANSTIFNTYGQHLLSINLGLRRDIQWPFIVANVGTAIIGADLISHYGLIIDLKRARIMDPITQLHVRGRISKISHYGLSTISADTIPTCAGYAALMSEYCDITKPSFGLRPPSDCTVVHHIVTE